MPDIYRYTNPLAFLRAAYREKRKDNRAFTHRALSWRLGVSSSAGFSHLLQGTVRIAERHVPILAEIFELDRREAEYLELLVGFSQAKTPRERRYALERLTCFKRVNVDTVLPHRYELYMEWYYSVVRALLTMYKFRGDYAALGHRLAPAIPTCDARRAIELLRRLGFIERRPNGYWRITERDITSCDDETVRTAVRRFNAEAIELAKQAVCRFDPSLRQVATLTLGVSRGMAEDIRAELRAFRRKAVAMVREASTADRVYQLNLQFYPLTRPSASGGTRRWRQGVKKEGRSTR